MRKGAMRIRSGGIYAALAVLLFIIIVAVDTSHPSQRVQQEPDNASDTSRETSSTSSTSSRHSSTSSPSHDTSSHAEGAPEQPTSSEAMPPQTTSDHSEARSEDNIATSSPYYSVTRVVDGDTIKVRIDGAIETVRLLGVDTPETKHPEKAVECFGHEATQFTKNMLSGASVRLEADPTQDDRGKYGRLIRYVYLPNGTHLNKELIARGYAHEYTHIVPYNKRDTFKAAEDTAREHERGLWAPGVCDTEATEEAATTSMWYTSSWRTAQYYYHESCDGWRDLTHREAFTSTSTLLATYNRTLHPECEI